jgi:hypothetical protein
MEPATKVCTKCGNAQPSTEYRHRKTWVENVCRTCTNIRRKERYYAGGFLKMRYANLPPEEVERKRLKETTPEYRANKRAYRNRPDVKARYAARFQERRIREAEKFKARNRLQMALRYGKIIRQPCEKCGAVKVHGHHDDYTKPLDVRWLCQTHHAQHHRRVKTKIDSAREIQDYAQAIFGEAA